MEEQRRMDISRKGGHDCWRITQLERNGKDKLRSPVTPHTKSVALRVHLSLPLVTRANFLSPSPIAPYPNRPFSGTALICSFLAWLTLSI